ncbi:MAG TPA: O-acetyl-ADP-ribose deacetylase [Frankiaceae bacterium]|jgi:O-acetyl-ADP-ribose deacetylase (regulator of RNase III)|nr:O-acetyl-ADP-ribose deacetylase [Frankiaceae bacterium]
MPRIQIARGDITRWSSDAVVNAANSSLLGGGGVDGAIHRAGGPAILEACRALRASRYAGGLPTGEAVATTAGDLPALWVIHTVGPVYAGDPDPAASLRACHVNALRVADEVGAASVAFPAISCGVYGYPPAEAAPVAVGAVLEADTRVELVTFVLNGDATYDAFAAALSSRGTPSG